MAVVLKQVTGSESPDRAGFSMEGGRAVVPYDLTSGTVEEALVEILGSCEPNGQGGLRRKLPMAHPGYPWLFATDVEVIGRGSWTEEEDPELSTLTEGNFPVETYASYTRPRLSVSFNPRMYAVLPDSEIQQSSVTHYNDAGSGSTVIFYPEWYRYTDVEVLPSPTTLNAQQGQMWFLRSDGTDVNTPPPHKNASHQYPRMILPDGSLKVRWMTVPYTFVTSPDSHLIASIGRINQREFLDYSPGQLLFMGLQAKRYTPPVPKRGRLFGESFASQKLCDIEMYFKYIKCTPTAPPSPTNASWIAGGWNCPPWLKDKKFYYMVAKSSDTSEYVPTHLSFAPELLFTDPDV